MRLRLVVNLSRVVTTSPTLGFRLPTLILVDGRHFGPDNYHLILCFDGAVLRSIMVLGVGSPSIQLSQAPFNPLFDAVLSCRAVLSLAPLSTGVEAAHLRLAHSFMQSHLWRPFF